MCAVAIICFACTCLNPNPNVMLFVPQLTLQFHDHIGHDSMRVSEYPGNVLHISSSFCKPDYASLSVQIDTMTLW